MRWITCSINRALPCRRSEATEPHARARGSPGSPIAAPLPQARSRDLVPPPRAPGVDTSHATEPCAQAKGSPGSPIAAPLPQARSRDPVPPPHAPGVDTSHATEPCAQAKGSPASPITAPLPQARSRDPVPPRTPQASIPPTQRSPARKRRRRRGDPSPRPCPRRARAIRCRPRTPQASIPPTQRSPARQRRGRRGDTSPRPRPMRARGLVATPARSKRSFRSSAQPRHSLALHMCCSSRRPRDPRAGAQGSVASARSGACVSYNRGAMPFLQRRSRDHRDQPCAVCGTGFDLTALTDRDWIPDDMLGRVRARIMRWGGVKQRGACWPRSWLG
jgi:hypothetical protein